jgi:hypothetical protein
MSNIFKSNSRFSALLDDKNDFKKDKQRKNEIKVERKETRFKSSDEKETKSYKLEIKGQNEFKKEKQKERLDIDILSINNFPELISVKKNDNEEQNQTSCTYIDILKKKEEVKDIIDDPDLVNLEPGWLFMKKDPQTRNTIMKYGIGTIFYEKPKRTEKEIILDIVDTLVELHEKRTEEYIELNGYDVWEKMFKYPNWEERETYLYEEDESSDEDEDEDDENDEDYAYYDDYDEYYDY